MLLYATKTGLRPEPPIYEKRGHMPTITIALSDEMHEELISAARATRGQGFGPAQFAEEAVESVLASRRLPRFTRPESRPRVRDEELTEYRLCLPEIAVHGRYSDDGDHLSPSKMVTIRPLGCDASA